MEEPEKKERLHAGHRARLKKQFQENGLSGLTEIQTLELILFYSIPQKDTNPLAHRLLERFGSLHQVLDAPVQELCKVPEIGLNTALFLHLIREAGRAYLISRSSKTDTLTTLEDCAEYLIPHFLGLTEENVFLLCLDAKCRILGLYRICEGNTNAADVSARQIVSTALRAGATSVLLAHNHPCGVALPSKADIQTTRQLSSALRAVDIYLVDHIIISEGDYVSLAQSYPAIFDSHFSV